MVKVIPLSSPAEVNNNLYPVPKGLTSLVTNVIAPAPDIDAAAFSNVALVDGVMAKISPLDMIYSLISPRKTAALYSAVPGTRLFVAAFLGAAFFLAGAFFLAVVITTPY
jgi:hypothetical protein|tara:strand:- start:194 stop:523 length:330 start_codon:yes stop_codon:yes gene_type:complete